MSDGKCPKCGRYLIPDGEDGFCRCGYDPSCKFMEPELALTAALHRIRELETTVAERERACFVEALQAAQAKDRVRELEAELSRTKKDVEWARQQLPFSHHSGNIADCPTFYDGCNCTVENLAGLMDQAHIDAVKIKELEAENDKMRKALGLIAECTSDRFSYDRAREALKK